MEKVKKTKLLIVLMLILTLCVSAMISAVLLPQNTISAIAETAIAETAIATPPTMSAVEYANGAVNSQFGGDYYFESGTKFEIYTAKGAAHWTANQSNYNEIKTYLMNDIDIGGFNWIPFGSYTIPLSDTFYGQGHTVSNIYINIPNTDKTTQRVGFIGYSSGIIQDLGIVGGSITVNGAHNDGIFCGGVVGTGLYINNCFSTTTVTNNNAGQFSATGGIAGWDDGRINNSYSASTLSLTQSTSGRLGGIAGGTGNSYSIFNCRWLNSVPKGIGSSAYDYATNKTIINKDTLLNDLNTNHIIGSITYQSWIINPAVNDGYPIFRAVSNVASVAFNNVTTEYSDFTAAWNAATACNTTANNKATIKLITDTSTAIDVVNGGDYLVLDTDSNNLTFTQDNLIGAGTSRIINNGGTLDIMGSGTISGKTFGDGGIGVVCVNAGTVSLDDATIKNTENSVSSGVIVNNNGTFNLNSGTVISGDEYAVSGTNSATVNLYSGTLQASGRGVVAGPCNIMPSKDPLIFINRSVSNSTIFFYITDANFGKVDITSLKYSANADGSNPIESTVFNDTVNEAKYLEMTKEVKVDRYYVYFNTGGGNTIEKQFVKSGDLVTKPLDPTRLGYTFGGWYKEFAATNPWNFTTDTVSDSTTIYAKWTANKYTVTFRGNGSTSGSMDDQSHTYGIEKSLTTNKFEKTGYTFSKWNTKADGTGKDYEYYNPVINMTATDNETITLYAQWSINVVSVTFNGQITEYNEIENAWNYVKNLNTTLENKATIKLIHDISIRAFFINDNRHLILDTNGKTLHIKNNTQEKYNGITTTNGGTLEIIGTGTISADMTVKDTGIVCATKGGTISLIDATISNTTNTGNAVAVLVMDGGIFNLYSGKVISVGKHVIYGTNLATVNLYSGTLQANGDAVVAGTTNTNIMPSTEQLIFINTSLSNDAKIFSDLARVNFSNVDIRSLQYSANADGINLTDSTVFNDIVNKAKYVTMTAIEPLPQYDVSFDSIGGTKVEQQFIKEGSKVIKPADPTKSDYIFGGWYKEQACTNAWDFDNDKVTEATTLYAKWTAINYTVTYDLDGGNATGNPETYTVGSETFTLSNPTRAGYVFAGWKGTDISGTSMTVTIAKGSTGAREYTATWVKADVSVIFNGDTIYYTDFAAAWKAATDFNTTAGNKVTITLLCNISTAVDVVNDGDFLVLDTDGFTLTFTQATKSSRITNSGGTLDIIGKGTIVGIFSPMMDVAIVVVSGGTVSQKDATIINDSNDGYTKAVVIQKGATYNLISGTIQKNGSSATILYMGTFNLYSGTIIGISANLLIASYNGGICNIMPSEDPLIFINNHQYQLAIFDLNYVNFTGVDITLLQYGKDSNNLITKKDNVFDITVNKAKYVVMQPMAILPKYDVSFDSNGGSSVSTKFAIREGSKMDKPANPKMHGYTFDGWYKDSKLTSVWDFDTDTVTATITLYAKWTGNKYYIAFVAYDATGSMENQEFTYATAQSLNTNKFEKLGATFDCWTWNGQRFDNNATLENLTATNGEVITFTAQWRANNYTVVFDANGGTGNMQDQKFAYGTAQNLKDLNYKRSGYAFTGWLYGDKTFRGEENVNNLTAIDGGVVNLVAQWVPRTYQIKYDLKFGTATGNNPTEYTIETSDFTLSNPIREGDVFIGWSGTGITDTIMSVTIAQGSTENRTYTANWAARVAYVDFAGATTEYTDFTKAWTYASSLDTTEQKQVTITLCKNSLTIIEEFVFAISNDHFIIDLNGKQLYYEFRNATKFITVDSMSSLEIKSSGGNDGFIQSYYSDSAIENNGGTVTICSGVVYSDRNSTIVNNLGTVMITGGKVTSNGFVDGTAIVNNGGIVTISGGIVSSNWAAIRNENASGKITISGNADISCSGGSNAIYLKEGSATDTILDIQGGTVQNSSGNWAVYNDGTEFGGIKIDDTAIVGRVGPTWGVGYRSNIKDAPDYIEGFSVYRGFASEISYFIEENPFEYVGHHFITWSIVDGNVEDYPVGREITSLTNHIELFAQWAVNTYTIKYDGNGYDFGGMELQHFTYGVYDSLDPNSYYRIGHTFTGWNDKADGTGLFDLFDQYPISTQFTQNNVIITLYAQWAINNYTVKFDGNGSTSGNMASQSFEHGTAQNLKANTFAKTGYTFDCWNTRADGKGTQYADDDPISLTSNIELYAQWIVNNYTVAFDGNGGTGDMASQTFTYGTAQNLTVNAFTKKGYSFVGWLYNETIYKDNVDGSALDTANNANVTFVAQWTAINYTVTYDLGGGNVIGNPESYTVENETFTLSNPTRAGYVFVGWSGTGITGTSMTVTIAQGSIGNRVYTVNWEKSVASVTFDSVRTEHGSFSDAWTYANSLSTSIQKQAIIMLYHDVSSDLLTISGKYCILDLNGKTLTYSGSSGSLIELESGGSLEITDSSDGSRGILSSAAGNAVYNNSGCTLTISGGTVLATTEYAINNYGSLTISGGTVVTNGTTSSSVAIINSGTVTVNGGTVSADSGIAISNNGTLAISGGTVSAGSGTAIDNNSGATVIISGSAVVTSANTNQINGTIYLSNGSTSITVLDIQGGTIENTASSWAVYNAGSAYGGIVIATGVTVGKVGPTWSISYNANGGTGGTLPDTYSIYKGFTASHTVSGNTLSRIGYNFDGYNTSADGNGTSYGVNEYITSLTGDITLYVQWAEKEVVTIDEDAQNFTYDGSAKSFVVTTTTSGLNGFTIEYYVYGVYTTDAPTNAGSYKVKITRAEDGDYKAFALELDGGLVIVKVTITISGITAENKTYDGKTDAILNYIGVVFSGIIGNDRLSIIANGAFANVNVGTGKTVNISGITLGGTSAGNYILATQGHQTTTTATISKANYTDITHKNFSGTYDPNKTLADYALNSNFLWETSTNVPTVNVISYPAIYNADSINYNDFLLNITVTLDKADFTGITHDGFTGMYDPNKTLANYVLNSNFRWGTSTTVPAVNVASYPAIYNADSANYNDFAFNITVTLAKANYTGITHDGFIGIYDPNKTLADYVTENFYWKTATTVPAVNVTSYPAIYNADSTNYNDFELNIVVELDKADYTNITHDGFIGKYDPSKTLADYAPNSNFRWENSATRPTVDVTNYPAIYNADSTNYNDFTLGIEVKLDKADYINITHKGFIGTFDPNKTLADYVVNSDFRWENSNIRPTVDDTSYRALYNADSVNYNDFALIITVTLDKANYTGITHDNFSGTYDPNTTLADYVLNSNFRWENSDTRPTVDVAIYKAIYNADSINYNDFILDIVVELDKADYDMSGITFADKSIKENQAVIALAISGNLPSGVTITYLNNSNINSGIYVVTAKFEGDATNYNLIGDIKATLTILNAELAESLPENVSGKPDVVIDSEDGLDPNITLIVKEIPQKDLTADILKNKVLEKAYNVTLFSDGVSINLDGKITIRLLLPTSLSGKNLNILHQGMAVTYQVENGYAVFITSSLGDFVIVTDQGSLVWLIILLILLLLAESGLVVYKTIKDKKTKKSVKTYSFAGLLLAAVIPATQVASVIVIGSLCVGVGGYLLYAFVLKDKFKKQAVEVDTIETAATEVIDTDVMATEVSPININEPNVITEVDEEENEVFRGIEKHTGLAILVRYHKSFMAKLIQATDESKNYYTELKNSIMSYAKVKSRISWSYDSINLGRRQIAKFNVKGKTLYLYLALNADDYIDTKYKVEKVDSKRYEDVPCLYKIKKDRRARYALDLIAALAEKFSLEFSDAQAENYYLPYETTEELVAKGLIKELISKEKYEDYLRRQDQAELDKNKREFVSSSEVSKLLSDEVAATVLDEDDKEVFRGIEKHTGLAILVRYHKSFTAKLIQATDELKNYYTELKNSIMSYAKVKSRISWSYDSINLGRRQIAKFNVKGKTLYLYLALNADDYIGSKYKVEKVDSKRYEDVPCLYKIKNERRAKYAIELIANLAEKIALTLGEVKTENYYLPYETTVVLVEKGLIKELISKEKYEDYLRHQNQAELDKNKREFVSASEVSKLLSDEVAAALLEHKASNSFATHATSHAEGKRGIINVDILSEYFESGDTVTLKSLIDKKLLPKNVARYKVLARGSLNKPLTVIAEEFSLDAIKMIILTGGKATKQL